MEDKYKKFLLYDFSNDSQWISYLSTIDPKPNTTQLLNLKKKFYKRNVDNDFDITYSPSYSSFSSYHQQANKTTTNTNANQQANPNHSSSQANPSSSQQANPDTGSSTNANIQGNNYEKFFYYAYFIEVFFYFYFFYAAIFSSSPYIFAIYGYFLRLLKTSWPVQINKQYFSRLLTNETFYFIIYAFMMMFFSTSKVFVFLMPTGITCLLFIMGFYRRNITIMPKILEGVMTKAKSYQESLLKTRISSEVLILPITIVGVFLGFNTFLLPVIYFQYLKMKISIDNKLTDFLQGLRNMLNTKMTSSGGVMKNLYFYAIKLCDYLKSN